MTLGEYLDRYKALINKYFSDTEKYAEERAQALHDFLAEMKGYYDSAISGVTTLIDHKIKGVQKQKDAALKAIEAERKAATEAYEKRIEEIDKVIKQKNKEIKQYEKVIKQLEKQKKALEKQKKEYEKQKTLIQKNSIDPLQKEIELIQKANNERDRQLQLQKDLYELERLQNQRTQFIYKDGQMVYQNDPEAARQQREQVNKDEQEDQVAKLEKQIELYETQIEQIERQQELIDEQIEKLDEQIEIYQEIIEGINEEISALEEEKEAIQETLDEINKFYDELKASTEEYFDSLIESLEETKSKWEELAEIDKIASAWKDVGGIMEGLGYSVEDVLNDVPGAFDAFKEAYIETLVGLNGGNEEYLRGLSEVTGKSVEELKKMGGAAKDAATEAKEPLEEVGNSIEKVGTKASGATGNVDNLATSTGTLATNANEASTNLGDVDEKVGNITDKSTALDSVKSSFNELRNALQAINSYTNLPEIAEAIGTTADGFTTLSNLDLATLGMNFDAIGTALEKCRMALSENEGGVASKMERIGAVDLTNLAVQLASVSNRMQEIATAMSGGETGVPVADSFERISQTAEQFNLLAAALQLCADAVGGGVDDPTGGLVGAINSLNEITFEEGLIAQFNALKESVDAVTNALGGSAGGGEEEGGGAKKQKKAYGKGESGGGSGSESEGGGGDTLTSALENVQSVAETTIGTQAITEEGSEGDGTVIGDFGALATTVGTARNAIGLGETEGEATLIGAVQNLGVIDNDVMRGGEGGEGGVIGDWNEFNEILGQAEEHITAMVKGLESLEENYSTTLKVTLEIEGDTEFTGTAVRGNRKGHYSFNILEAIGLPGEGGEWEGAVGHRKKQGKAHLSGTAKWGGDWAYDGGSTLISEIGPELVVFPDGHFEVFDRPQMVDLPKGSVIFNHLQTDEILDTKNQVHHLSKGSANANGTMGMTPLSIADPEQYQQLMQTAELLRVNTDDMNYSLGDIQYATDDIKKAVESITNNNTNNANITFGDLYFQLNGITSEEVMSEVGNALEKEFSGLALNAYQRAMKH